MGFRLIFEIEPPRQPDLKKVIRQAEVYGPIADALLIPDNHLGLPGLSSVAMAVEIKNLGFRPLVALNARDRNHLRLESDLLTLRAYGVDEVLFLYGDSIAKGRSDLTVKKMLAAPAGEGLQRGVVARIGGALGWRRRADFLCTKLAFGRDGLAGWRRSEDIGCPVYCGVIALPDAAMARRVLANIQDLDPPPGYLDSFDSDGDAGFAAAFRELDALLADGADGAHIVVPAGRRRFADMLERWIDERGIRS